MLLRGVLTARRAKVCFDKGVVGVGLEVEIVLVLREEYVLDGLFFFPVVLNQSDGVWLAAELLSTCPSCNAPSSCAARKAACHLSNLLAKFVTCRRVLLQRDAVQGASAGRGGRLFRALVRGIRYGPMSFHVVQGTVCRH